MNIYENNMPEYNFQNKNFQNKNLKNDNFENNDIKKIIDTNTLESMISGIKKYEAFVYTNEWKKILIGDIINFSDNIKTISVIITQIKHYKSFINDYNDLGSDIYPINPINEHVTIIYNKHYTMDEIKKYGVIVFKFGIIKNNIVTN